MSEPEAGDFGKCPRCGNENDVLMECTECGTIYCHMCAGPDDRERCDTCYYDDLCEGDR